MNVVRREPIAGAQDFDAGAVLHELVGPSDAFNGCRAVGIAGGADKCAYAVNELGFEKLMATRYDSAGAADSFVAGAPAPHERGTVPPGNVGGAS